MKYLYRILFLFTSLSFSQDNLEALLDPIDISSNDVNRTFLSTRIVNTHSVEIFSPGVLDFRISHRFGPVYDGVYELFGLDQSTIRIGLEYGVSPKFMIGLGRSTYNKNYDGFVKYAILQQSKNHNLPVSIVYFSSISIESIKKTQENYPFSGRINYCNQLLIGSIVNSKISVQIIPSFVHKNMVEEKTFHNNIFLFGTGLRYKLSKIVSLNLEYHHRLTRQDLQTNYNSFSVGFDIETGGHIFQLHFTNSLPMYEVGFLIENPYTWTDGGIHFGFNISREFILK
jgi:hypothetical protein